MPRTGRPRSFTESEVVDAATDMFWQHGYAATSMQRLGKEADVLPGSLHAAFGDKHTLFVRALERYTQGQRDFGASLQGAGPVLPRLRQMMYAIGDAAATDHPRGCMLGNTATELVDDATASGIVRDAFAELETSIAQALRRAQRDGEIQPDLDVDGYARALVALMQGLHVLARVETDPNRLHAAVDAALAPLEAQFTSTGSSSA
jgi:TetR/AcrR family transcriptional repressor of nem operon